MSKKRRLPRTLPITGLKGILPKPAAPVAIEDMNKGGGMPVQAIQKTPRYTRAELLAQCDPTAPRPEDMAIGDSVQPVGRERDEGGERGVLAMAPADQNRFAIALLSPPPPAPALDRAVARRHKLLRTE